MWIKSYIFSFSFLCLLVHDLWAQSPYRIATFSTSSNELCQDLLSQFGEAASNPIRLKRSEPSALGNDQARFGPFAVFSSKETAGYRPHPETGRLVHYIQILPGKLKFLRSKYTAFEVNVLLNQIKELIRLSGLIERAESSAIFGFKSVRYNLKANQENPAEIKILIKAIENVFRKFQRNVFESPSINNEHFDWALERLVAQGSGESEIEAVIAARFSADSVVQFSEVEEKVTEAIVELSQLSRRLKDILRSNIHTSRLVQDDQIAKSFFDNFRQFQTQADFIDTLRARGLTEGEAEELAVVAFRFFSLVDKFIPGTQFSDESIEPVLGGDAPRDRSPSHETKNILVADVKGAGSDILSEAWQSLERAMNRHLDPEESDFDVKAVLRDIDISPAIQRLNSALDHTVHEIQKIEGDNLIDYWVSGDEILFFLRNQSRVHRAPFISLKNVRLVEENQSSVAELAPQDRAYFREVVERSHKLLEKQYPDLPLKMVRANFQDDFFFIQVFLQDLPDRVSPSFEQAEAIKIAIAKDLRESFSDFNLLHRLEVDFF